MSLPKLTKNEKLIISAVTLVMLVFTITLGGYVYIRSNEYTPTLSNQPTTRRAEPSGRRPQLTTISDPEYNFSFNYPSDLTVQEVQNPRQKLLEFARSNQTNIPVQTSTQSAVLNRPTPSLESFASVIKKYSVYSPSDPETNLIDATVVKGDYEKSAKANKQMAQNLGLAPDIESDDRVGYFEIARSSGGSTGVLSLPYENNKYLVALYPLTPTHYLQLEIQPEFQDYHSTQPATKDIDSLIRNILESVK